MKFAKHLEDQAISEWRPKYIQYKQLKKLIKRLMETTRCRKESDNGHLLFIEQYEAELRKIDKFYCMREEEAIERMQILSSQIKVSSGNADGHLQITHKEDPNHIHISSLRHTSFSKLAKRRLKKALLEYYRSLDLLRRYQELNKVGCVKIVKKYEKCMGQEMTICIDKLKKCHFYYKEVISDLMDEVENVYKELFTMGDRQKATRKLRINGGEVRKEYGASALLTGFWAGISIFLIYFNLQIGLLTTSPVTSYLFRLYYMMGLVFLLAWLFILNIKIWDHFHINYRFIFEFNQRDNLQMYEYGTLVGTLTVWYLTIVYFSLNGMLDSFVKPHGQPWLILASLGIIFLFPLDYFYRSSRMWITRVILRIITSPYYPCHFKDFFLADQLISLLPTFESLGVVLNVTIQPLLLDKPKITNSWLVFIPVLFPCIWRCCQCFRRYHDSKGGAFSIHLINFLKYSLLLLSLLLAAVYQNSKIRLLFWLAFILRSVTTVYSIIWDIIMDFGLFQANILNRGLRESIVFDKFVYYLVMMLNIILRFSWLLLLIQYNAPFEIFLLSSVGEVIRRSMWSLLRVEYEHVNNCNMLRAFAEVPLPYDATDLFYQDMVETLGAQVTNDPNIAEGTSPTDDFEDEEERLLHD